MSSKSLYANRDIVFAIGLAVIAATAQSITSGLAKYLMHDYHIVQILCIRNAFLVGAILITAGISEGSALFRISDPVMQTSRAILPFLASVLLFLALKYVPLAEATAIMFASPLFITILSIYVLRERVGAKHWSAIVLGFLGVGIILRPGTDAGYGAALLLLLAAAFIALYQIITKTLSLTASVSATLLCTGAVGTVLTMLFLPFVWTTPDLMGAALITALGVTYGASHYFWFRALTIAPASTLAPFVYTQIIAATVFGFVVFHEVPDLQTVLGSLIIVGSGLIVFMQPRPDADKG